MSEFAKKSMGVDLTSIQGETTISGFFTIALGLVYHYFSEKLLFQQNTVRVSENDKFVARRFWEIYNEDRIGTVVNCDLWNGYIKTSDDRYLESLRHFLCAMEFQFTDSLLEGARGSFGSITSKLIYFSSIHFFFMRNARDHSIRYLYPDLNWELDGDCDDEKMARFDKFEKALRSLIDEFDIEIKSFVTHLKKNDLFFGGQKQITD